MAGYGEPSFHSYPISSSFHLQDRSQRLEWVWNFRPRSTHQADYEGAVAYLKKQVHDFVGNSFKAISFGDELGELSFVCLPVPQLIQFLPNFFYLPV
ncbi:MAG: hypothetical protein AB2L11_12600 [Syntrophobacteraceae bacterium]